MAQVDNARYAVFICWRNATYRYCTPSTGRNLWKRSTAMRLVRENTHLPLQTATMVRESDLSKWVV